ncbi:MAG: glycoside hydrolase family 13 protein [Anaerolineae bacterium]|nr:glycoside hydrolase family 13 protein [Anaerolineae bacterium]
MASLKSSPGWLHSVYHNSSAAYVSNPNPTLNETVTVQIRIGTDAPLHNVYLRTFPDGEQAITPMTRVAGEQQVVKRPFSLFQAPLPINQHNVHYRFILEAADGVWVYTAAGATAAMPLDSTDFQILADYHSPGWLETAVFYQLFPDRFHNADPSTNPRPDEFEFHGHSPQTYTWGESPDPAQPFPIVFYGGDLPGITEKLDYIQALGINALYLNPVFSAHSNHKYDVIDYHNVDAHFGGNEALVALRHALSTRNMRYILDIVPNHCGYWHPWFQTAQQHPNAPEADFFTFHKRPDEYASWLGVWTLPKLNYRSQELRRRMYEADDAIFKQWLQPPFTADGWRVDVANMLGRQGDLQIGTEIVEGIREAVKSTNPEAYLLGENFFDATASLQGNEWDGIMNYSGLAIPLLAWLRGVKQGAIGFVGTIESAVPWPTAALAQTWQHYLAAIPWRIALQQFNLLNSHDTPRLRSEVSENDALQRLAAIVQFTFPGIPCLYYGDEIGMIEDVHLHQRGCMIWDETRWNHDLLAFYKELIRLRRETAVLQTGGFQILAVEPDTIAYQREGGSVHFLIIAHRASTPRPASPLPVAHGGIADGTRFSEHFSGQEAIVQNGALLAPDLPQGATIWRQQMA